MKLNKYHNIEDYKKSLRDLDRFRNDFLKYLGNNQLFELDNLDEIIYLSLKSLYPINKNLKQTQKSIEEKAGEVLEHFKMKRLKEASLMRIGDDGREIISTNQDMINQSYKQRYLKHILRLKEAPKPHYNSLKIEAENHLLKINSNIQYYSNLKFIKDFKEKDKRPSAHLERTYLDYYFRCIDEQQKIIDFIFDGSLKDRAIAKSTVYPKFIPVSFILGFNDFPYYSAHEYTDSYFNHNLIDKSAHRTGEFPYDEVDKMEFIYNNDKHKFYKLYFKKIGKTEIFREIDYNLNLLPLTTDRKEIIEELKYLFTRKRWVSFYGLALSQIEGIFSEMLKYINSNNISDKSLFNKVDSLRDFYVASKYYFDYFQYHIPQLRNKHSHGILDGGEKEELNSFDLLLDIKFLLKVFTELDSPYISLTNTISKQDYQISTIDDIAILFELINALRPEYKKELKDRLDNFFNIQLIENKHLEYILYGVNEDFSNKINNLTVGFDKAFNGKISLLENNYKEIQEYFIDKKNVEVLNDEMYLYQTNLQNFKFYNIFYKNFKKLPNIDSELKNLIEKTFKNNIDILNKSSFLLSLI